MVPRRALDDFSQEIDNKIIVIFGAKIIPPKNAYPKSRQAVRVLKPCILPFQPTQSAIANLVAVIQRNPPPSIRICLDDACMNLRRAWVRCCFGRLCAADTLDTCRASPSFSGYLRTNDVESCVDRRKLRYRSDSRGSVGQARNRLFDQAWPYRAKERLVRSIASIRISIKTLIYGRQSP